MDKVLRNLLIGLIILGILVPIGIIAGGTANPGGTAFGEWDPSTLLSMLGYVPAGMQNLTGLYHAPLPDYGTDLATTYLGQSLGYYLAAVLGMGLLSALFYLVGKRLVKNTEDIEDTSKNE